MGGGSPGSVRHHGLCGGTWESVLPNAFVFFATCNIENTQISSFCCIFCDNPCRTSDHSSVKLKLTITKVF